MAINEKAWAGGFRRAIGDESLGATLALALDDTTKQLHICEISDAGTDWALSADTNPAVYIHSATNPATEYIKMYHDATNAYIDGVGATTVQILVAGTAEISIAAASVSPTTTNGAALGTTALMWSDLFLASGGVINFNNGDVTVTHAAGSLSIAGSTAGTTFNITSAAPTAANNGIYSLMTSSAAWTGSVAAIRGRNTVTATGAGGNCYGGWFNLLFSSGAPTGLGLSAGLYVEAGSNIATTGVSSVLMATLLGDADGAITTSPILTLADASTLKTNILLEVGFNAGATTVGTASSGTTKLYRTSVTAGTMSANFTEALRVMVNGSIRWIPLATSPD